MQGADESRQKIPEGLRAAGKLAAVLAVLALPIVLTLTAVDGKAQPARFGYTISLSLFLVPVAVLLVWYVRFPGLEMTRKHLLWAVGWLFALGVVMEVLFAATFFTFPNPRATLGIDVPVVGGHVPIEEFVFYLSGFVAVLLTYVWGDEFWLSRYNRDDYALEGKSVKRLVQLQWWPVGVGAVLVAAAVVFKKAASEDPDGFPAYFAYLVLAAVVPAFVLLRATSEFINWRALGFTMVLLLLVSLLWEVTLALPLGWWGYDPDWMMGMRIKAWHDLPVEAVLVWLVAAFTSVVIFEAVKLWRASGRAALDAFLGR